MIPTPLRQTGSLPKQRERERDGMAPRLRGRQTSTPPRQTGILQLHYYQTRERGRDGMAPTPPRLAGTSHLSISVASYFLDTIKNIEVFTTRPWSIGIDYR